MVAHELLKKALEEISHLHEDEEFLVKDLFKGYEWKRIPLNERLRLGVLFLNEVMTRYEPSIEILEKSPSNQQIYKIKQSVKI
ncbi:protein of unknown function [Fictibacillus solisalsi]|uniref:DUF1413 domain-containing protein n=1 Tax=Fictibacillus solisalsi TaxID=459525 RepID=A0A1G9VJS5_9BACL|nr:single-stranded DNA-binding protein [Fictibacillus solisalsi]SDM72065.1 protein of unknown function [Fictibacillus solisalsi]